MLRLEIVTPEKRVVDIEVDSVTLPTANGEAGIFPQHAPLVSALRPGVLSYTVKGSGEKFVVSGGFVEVNAEKVSVLADSAESPKDIDPIVAKQAKDDADRRMGAVASPTVEEAENFREALDLAHARLQVASLR